jgi:hypothetical protein
MHRPKRYDSHCECVTPHRRDFASQCHSSGGLMSSLVGSSCTRHPCMSLKSVGVDGGSAVVVDGPAVSDGSSAAMVSLHASALSFVPTLYTLKRSIQRDLCGPHYCLSTPIQCPLRVIVKTYFSSWISESYHCSTNCVSRVLLQKLHEEVQSGLEEHRSLSSAWRTISFAAR